MANVSQRSMEDGEDDDASGFSDTTRELSIDRVLSGLSHLLSLRRAEGRVKLKFLRRLADHSELHGLSAREAEQVLSMALRGGRDDRQTSPREALQLIRSIRPAAGVRFNEKFVLIVLGSLGGGGDSAGLSGLQDPMNDDASFSDIDSDEDTAGERSESLKRRKKSVDIRIQACALRLLLQLHSIPPFSAFEALLTARSRSGNRTSSLPSSFLTQRAHTVLDQSYGVLFHYIEYQTLRPLICQLLCLTTKRKHVRHHRIAKILAMRALSPADSHLNALLQAFSSYYPDILFPEAGSGRNVASSTSATPYGLKYPQIKWLADVYEVWNNNALATDDSLDDDGLLANTSTSLTGLVPPPTILLPNERNVFITEVTSSRDVGYRLDKITVPDNLASALGHRMTSLAVLAKTENRSFGRNFASLYEWMVSAIEDQFSLPLLIMQGTLPLERDAVRHENTVALLNALGRMIEKVGCCDSRLQTRLVRFFDLKVWLKIHRKERKALLELVEYFTPVDRTRPATDFLSKMQLLARHSKDGDDASLLFLALAKMFDRWAARDWQTTLRQIEAGEKHYWGTAGIAASEEYMDAIAYAVSKASTLANEALSSNPRSILLIHSCLSLHEVFFTDAFVGLHDLLLPPPLTLYLPAFCQTTAIMGLARQFAIVLNVRQLHQDYLAAKAEDLTSDTIATDGQAIPGLLQARRSAFYEEECSDRINDCVILLIDLIWRNNGFVSAQNGNVDVGLPIPFFSALSERCRSRGDEAQQIGSASHSATLAVLMEAYANDLVRQRGAVKPILHGPLTPAKLKQARSQNFPTISHRDFRDSFLNWLARQGARGVGDLLNSTITRFIRGQEVDQSTIFS